MKKTGNKYIKWTESKLEKLFEDNFIEDDKLFEFLKGRKAEVHILDETCKKEKCDCIIKMNDWKEM